MIRQTVLPFKLKRTQEGITARSGLALYAEFFTAMGVEALIDRHLPRPGSGRGFKAISYIKPLSMMLYGGGESIEDVRGLREDSLRELMGLRGIPSSSAIGDWLRRMGQRGGIEGMERVNDGITRKVLRKEDRKGYTLIVDPTIIESQKREAQMTYLGCKGYRPVIATLKENGVVIAYEFKQGNDNGGRLRILKRAFSKMPQGKKIEKVLLDAEYYSNEVIEYLEDKGVRWAICVDKDASVMESIRAIVEGQWRPLETSDGIITDREVAETVHTTNRGRGAFRLVVVRWKERQGDLFHDTYHYHCIATNMVEESAQEVVWRYNGRAQIENHIKEIKAGFGMEWMPSGEFAANAVHFAIGVMTYNLFIAQKLLAMPEGWHTKTIKSIRWLLVEVGGKLIEHGRRMVLKIAAGIDKYKIYLEIRRRTYELMLE
ncbi:MAG: IS1380 family transposase [Deltaproteobacteria bacterium]|nr:IS1380 family transposase [Deltaproteobacteria bacterium]